MLVPRLFVLQSRSFLVNVVFCSFSIYRTLEKFGVLWINQLRYFSVWSRVVHFCEIALVITLFRQRRGQVRWGELELSWEVSPVLRSSFNFLFWKHVRTHSPFVCPDVPGEGDSSLAGGEVVTILLNWTLCLNYTGQVIKFAFFYRWLFWVGFSGGGLLSTLGLLARDPLNLRSLGLKLALFYIL